MKLATIDNASRDGELIVVSRDNQRFLSAEGIASSLQVALDHWNDVSSGLSELSAKLDRGGGQPITEARLLSPLPRAYEWIDGSAYINHIVLVRKARGVEPPATLRDDPLVYQGGSGHFLSPTADIEVVNPEYGYDFEAEVCVVLGDTPCGVKPSDASQHVRLLLLVNDISLRNLIPAELQKGFGFFVSKPASAFAPFAITPDELGDHWRDGRVHLPLISRLNGQLFGKPSAGVDMHFSFFDLIAHITQTRSFTAGTILGSGTVSNFDSTRGCSCLQEKRMLEKIADGKISTPFLKSGDRVQIEMFDDNGHSIFGGIDQQCR